MCISINQGEIIQHGSRIAFGGSLDLLRMQKDPKKSHAPNRLKTLRLMAGMDRAALGKAVGTSKDNIRKYEELERGLSLEWVYRFAKALGCNPGDLLINEKNETLRPAHIDADKMLEIVEMMDSEIQINKKKLSHRDFTRLCADAYNYAINYEKNGEAAPNKIIVDLLLRGAAS